MATRLNLLSLLFVIAGQPEDCMDQEPSTETKDDQIQEFVTESQIDFGCASFPPL
jgi:hypothetical protein